jgi:hypothetical protein
MGYKPNAHYETEYGDVYLYSQGGTNVDPCSVSKRNVSYSYIPHFLKNSAISRKGVTIPMSPSD